MVNLSTTIHWHGLFQNQTNYYDGTQGISECGIPPGESLTYNFTTGDFSGSTWWHAHNEQYTDGISGALIVHPSDPPPQGFPTWDEDIVVELSDVYHELSAVITEWYLDGTGPVPSLNLEAPDSGAINGLGQYRGMGSYFNLTLQPNKTYRLRLIHTGSAAAFNFSIDGHPLTLIEADGTLLTPYPVSNVTLLVAQRYSVLLTTNNTVGSYWMRNSLDSALGMNHTDVSGIIRYGTNDTGLPNSSPLTSPPGLNLTKLIPAVIDPPPKRSRFYNVTMTIGPTSTNGTTAAMNNVSWTPLEGTTSLLEIQRTKGQLAPQGLSTQLGNQLFLTETDIQTVDILLINNEDGDHPFHLHGHRPWIMGFGTGKYPGGDPVPANQLRRDTFGVPGNGWLVLRYVSDNPGPWTLHCHIAWHMAAGMLMQVNSLPFVAANFTIPQDIVEQCPPRR